MTKKILALMLAVLMICTLGVIPVSAATNEAEVTIGNVTTPYATLEDAFAAVEADTSGDDATITLLDDVELLGYLPSGFTPNTVKVGLYYQVGENLTLDLNGKDITIGSAINEYGLYFRNNTSNLYTITIENSSDGESCITDNSSAWTTINLNHASSEVGPLTLNIGAGVTIKEGDARVKPAGAESATLCMRKNVTVNIQNGAKLSAKETNYVITGGVDVSTVDPTKTPNTLNIYDGATVAHEGAGSAILSLGTVNIYGGTITAMGGSALYPAGTPAQDYDIVYNVSGGTITADKAISTNGDKATFNVTGGTLTGDVALNAAEEGAGSALNITGGTLTGDVEANNNAAVSVGGAAVVTGDLNTKAGATSEIKGGTVGSVTVASGATATISGGTVKGDLTAATEDLTVTGGKFENESVQNNILNYAPTGSTIVGGQVLSPVKIPQKSRVSFVADGRLVGIVLYRKSQSELTFLPKVPAKEGYVGAWAEYELNGENMIVRAVYTPIAE